MSAPRTRVRDARPLPAVCVARQDLAVLGERVEPRRLAAVRSTYLALLELAGEPDGWSRTQLAARAGVGMSLLRDCLAVLQASGLVREMDDGSLQLTAPSGVESLPVDPEPVLRVVEQEPDPLDARAEAFFRWHAQRIAAQTGSTPSRAPAAIAAARRILGREPDGGRIRALVEWALQDRFYADKVVTMMRLDQWWARICLAYDASQGAGRQDRVAAVPDPAWRSVSYDSERVEVA